MYQLVLNNHIELNPDKISSLIELCSQYKASQDKFGTYIDLPVDLALLSVKAVSMFDES